MITASVDGFAKLGMWCVGTFPFNIFSSDLEITLDVIIRQLFKPPLFWLHVIALES